MIVEIVGGPRDGQQLEVKGHTLVIPEISKSIEGWLEEDPIASSIPTFRSVHYTVMPWHGRLCAVHPNLRSAGE